MMAVRAAFSFSKEDSKIPNKFFDKSILPYIIQNKGHLVQQPDQNFVTFEKLLLGNIINKVDYRNSLNKVSLGKLSKFNLNKGKS